MRVIAGHDLAKTDFNLTSTGSAFEPGADIGPIGRALRQVNILVNAAAPAMARKLVAVLEKIAERLECESIINHCRSISPSQNAKKSPTPGGA